MHGGCDWLGLRGPAASCGVQIEKIRWKVILNEPGITAFFTLCVLKKVKTKILVATCRVIKANSNIFIRFCLYFKVKKR